MTTADADRSFLDTAIARLIALALAIAIAAFIYLKWSAEITGLMAGQAPVIPITQKAEPVGEANPALEACLAARVGDVDRMKEEGIISDSQYEAFRRRATDLCVAQNPG